MRFSGIEVEAVATATQALSLIQKEYFDLYLLDTRLPDLDGFELCRRLRDGNSRAPILFFSSAADEIDKKRGIEAGANAYTIKPNVDELFGSIAQFVLLCGMRGRLSYPRCEIRRSGSVWFAHARSNNKQCLSAPNESKSGYIDKE